MSRPRRSQSSSVSVDADAPGDRQQVDDRVGRAADRAVDHDRVLERLAWSGSSTSAGPRAPSRRCGGRPCARAPCAASRRRESPRWSAAPCRAPRPSTPSSTRCPSSCSGRPSATCTPRPRAGRTSSSRRSCSISVNFQTCVPEPMSSPRYLPLSIGPPDTPIVGRSQDAAPISSAGVVLSQPISSTTPSNGLARIDSSTSIAAWLRNSIVVGRISVSPRLITGNSSGKPPASRTPALDVLGELAEVRVAGRHLATRCCRCRSPAGRRTGRAGSPGSSSTSGGRSASRSLRPNQDSASAACAWGFLAHGS